MGGGNYWTLAAAWQLFFFVSCGEVASFSSCMPITNKPTSFITTTSSLPAHSRRDALFNILSNVVAVGGVVISSTEVLIQNPSIVYADVDYSTIQDLLGAPQPVKEYVPGGPRPTYLKEPTSEFKDNEIKAAEFKRKNLAIKNTFVVALEKITSDPDDAQKLATDLDDIRRLVKENGGLAEGITKDEVVKTCRRRKAKKFWPTEVEVA